MTTTYDHSYGMTSGIKSVDAFWPLTPKFDLAQAAAARAAGKQVWWYICCGPHHPYANMFIEYPSIEGRLLMGAMTAKDAADGFLYYQISIWNSQKPITSGLYRLDPAQLDHCHGDGAWTCVGPDGTPLPTQRLENFPRRAGGFRLRPHPPKSLSACGGRDLPALFAGKDPGRLLPVARGAGPEHDRVRARDPAALYAWRNRLGDLIDRAPALLEPLLK